MTTTSDVSKKFTEKISAPGNSSVGIILGDFEISDPEKGRFNVWNEQFTDGDAGNAMFHSFFHMFWGLLSRITRGTPLHRFSGSRALFQGLVAFSLNYPSRRETFTATPKFLRICGAGPFRVITRRYVLSVMSQLIGSNRAIPSWMSTHPVFCSIRKRLHDDDRYFADPFGAWTRNWKRCTDLFE